MLLTQYIKTKFDSVYFVAMQGSVNKLIEMKWKQNYQRVFIFELLCSFLFLANLKYFNIFILVDLVHNEVLDLIRTS